MRVRNKELLRKWHRKEQRIKELIAEAKKSKGDSPKVKAAAKPAPAKPAAAKAAAPVEKKAPVAKKPKAEGEVAEKPKKAPAKKKSEDEATPEAE